MKSSVAPSVSGEDMVQTDVLEYRSDVGIQPAKSGADGSLVLN